MRIFLIVLSLLFSFSSQAQFSKSKQQFIDKILPAAQRENAHIRRDRQRILQYHRRWLLRHSLSPAEQTQLQQLATTYHMRAFQLEKMSDWQELLQRVDIVPPSLILAQAANESAWGQSRFAREGHNYFGQWCYSKGCGIVPLHRPPGRHYEVAKFTDTTAAVQAYLLNINTNPAYHSLRRVRAQQQHSPSYHLSGSVLAKELQAYSSRGAAYTQSLIALIDANHMDQFDY